MDTEFITVNLVGPIRRVTVNGRKWLIASATLIVPGVLPGSDGPILYPPEEVARNYTDWNGMPLVAKNVTNMQGMSAHPYKDGKPTTARQPGILANQGVGYLYNAALGDGSSLQGEAWFDEEDTRRVDARIIQRLEAGQPVELSTGLGIPVKEKAPDGAVHNGKAYHSIGRGYRPDHVAVLVDEIGACSVKDGCGILVNADTPNLPCTCQTPKETNMDRTATVNWLTTNCDCWKGKEAVLNDEKVFNNEELAKLKAQAEKDKANAVVANTLGTKLGTDIVNGIVTNAEGGYDAMMKKCKEVMTKPTTNDTPPVTPPPTGNMTAEDVKKIIANLTPAERMGLLPAQDQMALNYSKGIVQREFDTVVNKLKAIAEKTTDPLRKKLITDELTANTTPDKLETLAKTLVLLGNNEPAAQTTNAAPPWYLGLGGGPTTNTAPAQPVKREVLETPSIEYNDDKIANAMRRGKLPAGSN